MRFRLSIRTFLAATGLVCVLLGGAIQFGPHLLWKISEHGAANVVAVPTQSLVDVVPDDKLVVCSVGPIEFEIPAEMVEAYQVIRGIGGVFLNFYDTESDRQLIVEIPTAKDAEVVVGDVGNPAFSHLSFPRIHKMIVESQSSDFSWFMTRKQLADHAFRLTFRALSSDDDTLLEYMFLRDFEATLAHGNVTTFQWVAISDKLSGSMHFNTSSPDDKAWIRHCSATLSVKGDPLQIGTLEDHAIRALVKITEVPTR